MSFKNFAQDAADYLKHELELRMQGRHHYSLRKFAQDLEMSPGTLVDFLKGRLGFSRTRADFVAHEIGLSPVQREHFWDLIEGKFSRTPSARTAAQERARRRIQSQKISAATEITAKWYHQAIVELIDLDSSLAQPVTLARVLGISVPEARQALDRLFQVGMVKNLNGRVAPGEAISVSREDLPHQVLRQVQTQILNLAQNAIENQRTDERENFAAFLSIKKSDIPRIRQELRQAFYKALEPYVANESRDAVYCFGMQLFKIFEKDVEREKDSDWSHESSDLGFA